MGEPELVSGGASGSPEWISSEELLRQLVEEHGETHFVFRRVTLAWERTAEWVGDMAANTEGEGPIRDVKSKKRCWHASSRMHVCSAHDYTSHLESYKYVQFTWTALNIYFIPNVHTLSSSAGG